MLTGHLKDESLHERTALGATGYLKDESLHERTALGADRVSEGWELA